MFWHCETITREATKATVQVTTAASATAKAAATVAEAVAGPAAVANKNCRDSSSNISIACRSSCNWRAMILSHLPRAARRWHFHMPKCEGGEDYCASFSIRKSVHLRGSAFQIQGPPFSLHLKKHPSVLNIQSFQV